MSQRLEEFARWLAENHLLNSTLPAYMIVNKYLTGSYRPELNEESITTPAFTKKDLVVPQIVEIPSSWDPIVVRHDNPFVGNTLSRKQRRHLRDLAERTLGQDT